MSGAPALSEKLSANLAANGIAALNPLQLSALDAGMRGLDMIVHAETGSGKTLCFGLPLLSRIEPSGPPLQALILAPTLELAAQITRVLNALQPGAATALERDATELPETPVLVGPPAMVLRLLSGGGSASKGRKPRLDKALLNSLRVVVLDEADALIQPLSRYATVKEKAKRESKPKEAATLLSSLCDLRKAELQVLAASATVGRPLRRELASLSERTLEVLREPADAAPVAAEPEPSSKRAVGLASGLSVSVVTSDADNFIQALHDVLRTEGEDGTNTPPLLFIPQGRSLAKEIKLLRQCELDALALDAAVLTQKAITPDGATGVVAAADGEERKLLVAAPSGARGLDLHGLDCVLISGVPPTADAFVHLAGRAGRQGAPGRVVILTTPEEAESRLPSIGSQLGMDLLKDKRHLEERNEKWIEMWTVHEKIVGAEAKAAAALPLKVPAAKKKRKAA